MIRILALNSIERNNEVIALEHNEKKNDRLSSLERESETNDDLDHKTLINATDYDELEKYETKNERAHDSLKRVFIFRASKKSSRQFQRATRENEITIKKIKLMKKQNAIARNRQRLLKLKLEKVTLLTNNQILEKRLFAKITTSIFSCFRKRKSLLNIKNFIESQLRKRFNHEKLNSSDDESRKLQKRRVKMKSSSDFDKEERNFMKLDEQFNKFKRDVINNLKNDDMTSEKRKISYAKKYLLKRANRL